MPADSGSYYSSLHPTDTIMFSIAGFSEATKATATLFDGDVPLVTDTRYLTQQQSVIIAYYWTDSSSIFGGYYNPIKGDLSSVIDRSIIGRISVRFDGVFDYDDVSLIVGNGLISGSISIEGGNESIVNSIAVQSLVSVPLPASIWFFGFGVLMGIRKKPIKQIRVWH